MTALLKDIIISFKGFGAKCNQVLGSGTTQQDIKEILRVHNELRAKLANGLEKRGKPGPQPPAADMEEMVRIMNDCSVVVVVDFLAPWCAFFSRKRAIK